MESFPISPRNRVKRLAERGTYDRNEIYQILDAAFMAHVGFELDKQVFVMPMTFVRIEDSIYVHGSAGSRLMRTLASGAGACVTVTHLDGLVLARSAFHHSMNYRSAIVFGNGREVPKNRYVSILDSLMERFTPGRSKEVRLPSEIELKQTLVVEIPIEEASAKIRKGPPKDDEEDYGLNVWAGVLPLSLIPGEPESDPEQRDKIPTPDYLKKRISNEKA